MTGLVGQVWRVGQVGTRRRILLASVLILIGIVGVDASRVPERQWTAAVAVRAIHVHQRMLAPAFDACGLKCRFTPSCSRYAEAVLRKHGIVAGSWLALRRIARCGPWTPAGTVDLPD